MKTVSDMRPYYEKLVKEFIVNLFHDCNIKGSQKYKKVYVRGKCVKFSNIEPMNTKEALTDEFFVNAM